MSREFFSEGENPDKKIEEEKLKNENKPENLEEEWKEMSAEEIKVFEKDIRTYIQVLEKHVKKIKTKLETKTSKKKASELQARMEELQIQIDGLMKELIEGFNEKDYTTIRERPEKK